MNEQEALARMVAPGQHRPGKWRGGVIQIHVTRACDKACFNCTQGSELAGRTHFMPVDMFEQAVKSLEGYAGVVGVFGGNPALHPLFEDLCDVLIRHVPREQRGLWCNHPIHPAKARKMRETFDPAVSNLNCHLDESAYRMFKEGWPECSPFGMDKDSRHSPVFVAMRDVLKFECDRCDGCGWHEGGAALRTHCGKCDGKGWVYDEALAWDLISRCDINQHWSAMLGMFRGQLRAWFCEVAGAQSILHQDEPDYPDTGSPIVPNPVTPWWQRGMWVFAPQVRKHCHECGVPLRGEGTLAQADAGLAVSVDNPELKEQCSETHASVFRPKRKHRRVELVTVPEQLGHHPRDLFTSYVER
jgi:hypothetical protein